MVQQCDLSERRACKLVGLSRDSYRHPPEADVITKELSSKIVEITHARRRFGYRRIHDMLRPHFPGLNLNKVFLVMNSTAAGAGQNFETIWKVVPEYWGDAPHPTLTGVGVGVGVGVTWLYGFKLEIKFIAKLPEPSTP